jgi:hypothetical protein
MLLLAALIAFSVVLVGMLLGGCRGPDVFGVGAGVGRGDGGISGPLSPGGPPGPQGPSSGNWDTDSEAWNLGAWVTWDLAPRKVYVVNQPPPSSWRVEQDVTLEASRTPPEALGQDEAHQEPPSPPDAPEAATQPPDAGGEYSAPTEGGGIGVLGGSMVAAVGAAITLLIQNRTLIAGVVKSWFAGS